MLLPVLQTNSPSIDRPINPAARAALAGDLARLCRGQVRFSRHDRLLYATDASMYQIEPIGIVIPADADDAQRIIEFCFHRHLAMLPRGGGTSLAGSTVNHAVVIDLTPGMRALKHVDAANRTCEVESGISIDDLNTQLAQRDTGLYFAPDPATSAQSAIGGNIATNAAGTRSILYGRTSENLLAIDACLASGERVRFEAGAGKTNPTARALAEQVIDIVRSVEPLIRERYPKTLRQNAGYGLDRILKQLDAGATAETLDLAQLLCGSEGTLATTLAAKLKLVPVPKSKGLALLAFTSVDEAIAAVIPILSTGPSAVELVDNVVIEAARNNLECSPFVDAFPKPAGTKGDPVAVLYVEYHSLTGQAEITQRFAALEALVPHAAKRLVTDAKGMGDALKLRKAGEPLLHGLPGARKPLTFVEDNVVPVENLGRFVREFRAIVEREGTRAAFWAHASVGVLHVRPMLDPHDPADLDRLQRIAVEVADLAKSCGGVMSGEHGDGRIRGPFLRRFFGPELMTAFAQVKAAFDPKGLLNPGNIVAPGDIASIVERTRIAPLPGQHPHPHVPAVSTFFDYADQDGFGHAIEMCNGAGVCRKTAGGTMCPSYRATLDERHSTRGRGNALRMAITGQASEPGPDGAPGLPVWNDPETIATLDLCLSCKACKSECPSNVDISKLKAEYTAQRYQLTGTIPLAARLTGHVRALNRLGSLTPLLANAISNFAPVRALIGAMMHMHPRRSLPRFSTSLYRLAAAMGVPLSLPAPSAIHAQATATPPTVALFADCFTTYNESSIGIAAINVLRRLGYRVVLPRSGCCGRSMISVGMLPQAIATVDATLAQLRTAIDDPSVKAIVVSEPSCLSAMKDDWLTLKCQTPLAVRKALAAKAMLVEEFVDRHWDSHPAKPTITPAAHSGEPVLLHGHCHQKALWGAETSARALRRFFGPRVRILDTGCCGMAGSFGFDADKFDLSMKIAELPGSGLLPHIRAATPGTITCAPGTSCRHQVHDGLHGQHRALHPIELIDRALS